MLTFSWLKLMPILLDTHRTVADPDRFHGFHGTPPFTQEYAGDQLATQLVIVC